MKKILTFILILLLIVLAVQLVVNGIEIGNLKLLSIKELKDANTDLNDKILQADKITETNYKSELSKLETKIKELQDKKQKYEELVAITSESNYEIASREENYKVEYLYYQIGEIAKKNEVDLRIEISTGSSGVEGLYDVTLITSYEAPITDESGYVRLTDFIYDVENDETLGFKVEDFSLVPYSVSGKTIEVTQEVIKDDGTIATETVTQSISGYGLEGTFTAKNIAIQDITDVLLSNDDETKTENGEAEKTENKTENDNKAE